jgi:hypothetical protein
MIRSVLPGVVLLAAGFLTACGDDAGTAVDEPEPESLVTLAPGNGCGDVYFWAATADDTVAVTVTVDQRERSTTEPTLASYDVGDAGLEVKVLRGEKLSTTFCTDILMGHPVKSETDASAGHVEVRLDPGTPDMLGCGKTHGSVTVTGLTGDGLSFDDFTVDSDMIGCYAG